MMLPARHPVAYQLTEQNMKRKGDGKMDKEMNNTRELNMDEMDRVAGGVSSMVTNCPHTNRVKTGREREDSRFIFWSQHQYEYLCKDCQETFWVDEER